MSASKINGSKKYESNIHKQLADIKAEIEERKALIKGCQGKLKPLRMTIILAKTQIKELKEKRRKLVMASVSESRFHIVKKEPQP